MIGVGRGDLFNGHAVDRRFTITTVLSNVQSESRTSFIFGYVIWAEITTALPVMSRYVQGRILLVGGLEPSLSRA